jgi:hypothetical protein
MQQPSFTGCHAQRNAQSSGSFENLECQPALISRLEVVDFRIQIPTPSGGQKSPENVSISSTIKTEKAAPRRCFSRFLRGVIA